MSHPRIASGVLIVLTLGLFLSSVAAAQNLIQNGDFESGAVPSCSQGQVPPPWFLHVSSPDLYTFSCATAPGIPVGSFANFTTITAANDGLRFVAGTDAGFLESFGQTLATPLVSGQSYRIGGAFSQSNSRPDPAVFDIFLSTSTSTNPPDATLVATLGAGASIGSWTPDEAVFVAPPNAATAVNLLMVTRSLPGGGNSYMGSDSWTLELVGAAAVPGLGSVGRLVLAGFMIASSIAIVSRRKASV